MATYTENYNLKMPSGQDAPDVEDFNTNAEIIDTVLKAHSDNTADEYSPDETYTAGRLVIQNNALWKAKQDISVAETWTPDHWGPTTLAAELSAVNSRRPVEILEQISFPESTSLTKTGISVVIPAKSFYAVTVMILYSYTAPSRVLIESGSTALGMNNGSGTSLSTSCSGYTDEEITLTCSAMFPAASGNSTAKMTGFYIPMS